MRLIRTATLLGTGYLLGARAGTARYDQIIAAARRVAARPQVRPYLGPLADRLPPAAPAAPPAAPAPAPVVSDPETPLPTSGPADLPAGAVLDDVQPPTSGIGKSRLRRRATAGPGPASPPPIT